MPHRSLPGRRASALLASLALAVTSFVVAPSASATEVAQLAADVVEPTADPVSVSADALPTVQIDGIVWKQVIVGNTVYVGGEFANARPAGAAPGTNLVPRTNLLAYNLTTGVLTSFNHTLNGNVTDMAASPDGTKLYVVGGFTTVDGVTRNRIAAFNLPSGTLNTSFAPNMNGNTKAVTATATTVYAGGYFSAVNGHTRYRVAAINAANGALRTGFVPVVDDRQVQSIVVSPDEQSVMISGSFTSVNSDTANGYGIAWLDAATGATRPLPVNTEIRNAGDNSGVMRLASDGAQGWYGVGWHYGKGGTSEGTFKVGWADGALIWLEDCHGDTYDVAPIGNIVYTASHKHYCGNSGGFPQTPKPWAFYHSTAWINEVRGTNTKDIWGYPDHPGTPRPELLTWYPQTDIGTYSGKDQAVWTVTGNNDYVLYGGEFPRVNGVGQQGLVRYAKRSAAPNKSGPVGTGAELNPTVASVSAGTVRINLTTTWDRDDEALTYRVYRDSETAAPIFQEKIAAKFWSPKKRTVRDTGLAPGSAHRYRLTVTDPWGNVKRSEWIDATVSAAARSDYADTAVQDGAEHLWRLGEPIGSTGTYDWAGGDDLTVPSSVRLGTAGAITGDPNTAATFQNSAFSRLVSTENVAGPDTFSVETWIKGTGAGRIVGFGNNNSASGTSTSTDRLLYVDSGGRLTFGVNNGSRSTLRSPGRVDNGAWHHVVATLGPDGMQLFVDGVRVGNRADVTAGQAYTGYWRIGADTLSGWPNRSLLGGDRYTGAIDDVAVYPTVLSAAAVLDHYTVARDGGRPNQLPVATASVDVHGFELTADGGASADTDGNIASWAWNFGDGTTGTGQQATHTYAAPGTYTVTLTVTDNEGATDQDTVQVEATAPAEFAADDFARDVAAGGWGAASRGGAWTLSGGASSFSVAGGGGLMALPTAGTNRKAQLQGVAAEDVEIRSLLSLEEISDGGGTFVSLAGRTSGFSSEYRAKVWIKSTGAVQLQLNSLQSGETTLAAANITGLTVAAGEQLAVRMQVLGTAPTTIRAKVWTAGTAEPAAWQLTTTNTVPELQDAGAVGYAVSNAGSVTTGANVVRVDDFWAGPPSP